MTARELVALGDLAVLRDVDADHLVHAVRQLVAVLLGILARDLLDGNHGAGLAVGHAQRGVAHLAALLAEDGAKQTLLRRELGLALRGDLAHEDVAGLDLCTNANDATLVEVGHGVLAHVRQVARDLLGAQLGLTGVDLVLLDVDRGERVVLYQTLRDDHGILVVVTVPRHEGDQQVLAKRHLALLGGRAIGQHGSLLHAFAVVDERHLVIAGGLVGALELGQLVARGRAIVVHHTNDVGGDVNDHARLLGQNDVAGIDGGTPFGAGAHERALGLDERDGLTLHVRTHERSVAFIVLEERNQRCADRHHLARGDVHVIDHLDRNVLRLAGGVTHQGFLLDEVAVLVELLVGLGDHVLDLAVSGHVDDLVGHMAVLDLAVRGLDEAEGVDAAEGRQRADEADVRAFRGLDRAHAAEVRRVHVSHLHGGAVARQAAGAQRGETALVRDARQRVVLIHELRELGRSEELLDRRIHRTNVDE